MPDDVRDYIRAAQQAETRGDIPEAVSHLLKAASLYRSNGSTARALQMLRHARRLDGSRQDIIEEINRLEWLPDRPLQRAVSDELSLDPSTELRSQLERLLQPVEEPPPTPGEDKAMFDRGPTRADPALNAWCSFCCKPKKEIGELVAGPAGAFICSGCLFESARLLAVPLAPVSDPLPAELEAAVASEVAKAAVPARKPRSSRPALPFFGQTVAARAAEQALARGARLVLVVGPEGTGKSAFLAELERRGVGRRGEVQDAAPVLFVDGFEALSVIEREGFAERFEAEPTLRAVLCIRAEGVLEPLNLLSDDGPFVLHPTATILSTMGQVLPRLLGDHVDLVAVFEPLQESELRELAHKLVEKRAAELDLSEDVLSALVAAAAKSGRGGRELEALIRRIPPGSWGAAPKAVAAMPAAPAKPKRSRKKAT